MVAQGQQTALPHGGGFFIPAEELQRTKVSQRELLLPDELSWDVGLGRKCGLFLRLEPAGFGLKLIALALRGLRPANRTSWDSSASKRV